MTDKIIKNETWYVKQLEQMVSNGGIYKPQFQRKRKWRMFQKKGTFNEKKAPNEKEFINFLFIQRNGVHPITFGQDGDKLSNIDGNNRINAIMRFLKTPFILYPGKLEPLKKYLDEEKTCGIDVANQVINIVKEMTYDELMSFKYSKFFIDKDFAELYNKHLKNVRDEVELLFDELVSDLKINGKDRFDNDVKINVNICIGYSAEELSDVFKQINEYSSSLTEQEILASKLFNINNFTIHDKRFECEIKNHIKKYYHERNDDDEELDCFEYDETTYVMNPFDFMVGFQNYSNEKCDLIDKTDNDTLSLFFKIFKNFYNGQLETRFTTENINDFINIMLRVVDILQKFKSVTLMENFVGGSNKLFDTANKKLASLKRNNKYLIIVSIIGYLKINENEDKILNTIEKCILYHFFINSLDNKEERDTYKPYDGISYEAGGKFIENKAKEYLKSPKSISSKITKEIMHEVLLRLTKENVKNKKYETRQDGKDKYDRRARKLHEKVLIYYYFVCKVPTQFLRNNFWIEHVFPFSSSWDNEIDTDRLGNIIPIIDALNKQRSNKHINEYKKLDKTKFLNYIDTIPDTEQYNTIITHADKKPHISNSDTYNAFCVENETKLIECFLEKLKF